MALIALTATAGGCTGPWSHLEPQVLTQLPTKLLHIALTIYGYSGGVIAPEIATLLATAAECCILHSKF